jgi:DNA invertase Pin-like site-specific DNA recombinase
MVNYAYLRVSTTAQDVANQKLSVLEYWPCTRALRIMFRAPS